VDLVLDPIWVIQSSCSHDFFEDRFPLNEAILEAMFGPNRPWDDMHHRSYFLSELVRIEQDEFRSTLSEMVSHVVVSLYMHGVYVEENMMNIFPTVVIDISLTPGKIENAYISADYFTKEIHIYTDIFKEFRDVFLVHMNRFQGSTPSLSNMILKLIGMLNLFDNVL